MKLQLEPLKTTVRNLQELNENVEKLQNDIEDRTILESIQDFKEHAPRSNAIEDIETRKDE